MANDPQENGDVQADDELSDEGLGDVSGAGLGSMPKK
jgi:hypothetical protein